MLLVIGLVFAAVFAIVALLVSAMGGAKPSKQTKSALASVLKGTFTDPDEEIVDVRKNLLLSTIPWLHSLLSRINIALELRHLLNQADLTWTPGRLMLTSLAIWVVSGYFINLRIHSSGGALLLGLAAGTLPLLYVFRKRRVRLTKIQEKLPEVMDLMVSALRAGHSMSGALGAAAREAPEPLGREFRLCFEEQNFGIDLRTATDNLLERVPLPDLRIVTTAMLIHKESGGNLAEVLEKTGLVVRERFRLQQQIRVHTAQGRLTGAVLISMPIIIGIFLYVSSPAYIGLLFIRPMGHKMLIGAAVMNTIGLIIIRKIINIRT
jgi:tight adherence protein B